MVLHFILRDIMLKQFKILFYFSALIISFHGLSMEQQNMIEKIESDFKEADGHLQAAFNILDSLENQIASQETTKNICDTTTCYNHLTNKAQRELGRMGEGMKKLCYITDDGRHYVQEKCTLWPRFNRFAKGAIYTALITAGIHIFNKDRTFVKWIGLGTSITVAPLLLIQLRKIFFNPIEKINTICDKYRNEQSFEQNNNETYLTIAENLSMTNLDLKNLSTTLNLWETNLKKLFPNYDWDQHDWSNCYWSEYGVPKINHNNNVSNECSLETCQMDYYNKAIKELTETTNKIIMTSIVINHITDNYRDIKNSYWSCFNHLIKGTLYSTLAVSGAYVFFNQPKSIIGALGLSTSLLAPSIALFELTKALCTPLPFICRAEEH